MIKAELAVRPVVTNKKIAAQAIIRLRSASLTGAQRASLQHAQFLSFLDHRPVTIPLHLDQFSLADPYQIGTLVVEFSIVRNRDLSLFANKRTRHDF